MRRGLLAERPSKRPCLSVLESWPASTLDAARPREVNWGSPGFHLGNWPPRRSVWDARIAGDVADETSKVKVLNRAREGVVPDQPVPRAGLGGGMRRVRQQAECGRTSIQHLADSLEALVFLKYRPDDLPIREADRQTLPRPLALKQRIPGLIHSDQRDARLRFDTSWPGAGQNDFAAHAADESRSDVLQPLRIGDRLQLRGELWI